MQKQQIQENLIETSFQDSGYWAHVAAANAPLSDEEKDKYFTWQFPFLGGWIAFQDAENGDNLGILNKESLPKGWALFEKNHPKHYDDAVNENHDTVTADIFLQLVCARRYFL